MTGRKACSDQKGKTRISKCLSAVVWIVSPKSLYVKGLVLSLCHYWKVMEPLGGGASRKKLGHWGQPLEGETGTPDPPFLSLFSDCHKGMQLPPLWDL
jgi:hypothetical protein